MDALLFTARTSGWTRQPRALPAMELAITGCTCMALAMVVAMVVVLVIKLNARQRIGRPSPWTLDQQSQRDDHSRKVNLSELGRLDAARCLMVYHHFLYSKLSLNEMGIPNPQSDTSGNRVSLNPVGHDHFPYQNAMFGVYRVFRHPHIIYVGESFPDVPL